MTTPPSPDPLLARAFGRYISVKVLCATALPATPQTLRLTQGTSHGFLSRNSQDRLKGFLQSAQTLAVREGHQQFTPEHLLKVLLDDEEGLAAGLIKRAGGDPGRALQATEATLKKLPSVEGSGAGQSTWPPKPRASSTKPSRSRRRRATLRHRRTHPDRAQPEHRAEVRAHPERRRRHAAKTERSHQRPAQGPHRRQRLRRTELRRAQEIRPRSDRGGARANSIPSSAATKKSAAPSRCCRAAPRTTPC